MPRRSPLLRLTLAASVALVPGCYDSFVALEPTSPTTSVPVDFRGAPGDSYFAAPNDQGATGRFVVFASAASDLVMNDENGHADIFLRDRVAGTTTLVSVSSSGEAADGSSDKPELSRDGRYVVFSSFATNFAAAGTDTNGFTADVFLRDLSRGLTTLVSVTPDGRSGDAASSYPDATPDGRFIVFQSLASDLVAGDTNAVSDVFVRDLLLGTTERVSVSTDGIEGNDDSSFGRISDDGRFVVFVSQATTLVPDKTTTYFDVFLRDRVAQTTIRISEALGGGDPGGDSYSLAEITPDGRLVMFASEARNLVADDRNEVYDAFLYHRETGITERVSLGEGGVEGDVGIFTEGLGVTDDGRFVVWSGAANNMVAGDTNGVEDVFLRDLVLGQTTRIEVGDVQGNGPSRRPSMSADGRCIVFESAASNLFAGDDNGAYDIFTVFR